LNINYFSYIDHITRCKQHWSRSTSCFSFSTLHKKAGIKYNQQNI